MNFTSSNKTRQGFSMVEAIVVIATIGILTALAVPMAGNIRQASHGSMIKRSAQQAASVSAAATAAGIIHVFPQSSGGVEATLALLRQGVIADSEWGAGTSVYTVDIREDIVPEVAEHLALVYANGNINMIYAKPSELALIPLPANLIVASFMKYAF